MTYIPTDERRKAMPPTRTDILKAERQSERQCVGQNFI